MRPTLPRQLVLAAALAGCLTASAVAAPPKPALVRDVDRPASASVDLTCSGAHTGCSVDAIPAGKRFVTSYVSYQVLLPSGAIAVAVLCATGASLDCGSGRAAFLPVAIAVPFAANLLIAATGTPITMVFEPGETPGFIVATTALPSGATVHILGHFEDL